MIEYNQQVVEKLDSPFGTISSFLKSDEKNIDKKTVESFGNEWDKFDHFTEAEVKRVGDDYFDIVNEIHINKDKTIALDIGCGTGRWTKYLAPKVKFVECVDPSKAVFSAAKLLKNEKNIRVSKAGVDNLPFDDNSFDFVFSLGVLHHVPNTKDAIKKCVEKIKPGGYFLVYLYYNLDNRGGVFKSLFWLMNLLRLVISNLPYTIKAFVCDVLAYLIYLPLILVTKWLKYFMPKSNFYKNIPLSWYADKSFKIAKNDSLDRFGTPLEQRFSRKEIEEMLIDAGLSEITFSETEPYWHVIAKKK